ncbi:MAG: hypothetical protein LWX56_14430 [Ignavibacteria bacterium]|nr:hypothetical protein [Ignavibacteria bacterium]
MILDVQVIHTSDGFTAEVTSLRGCESWAASEDEAVEKVVDLARYYLNLPSHRTIRLDKVRDNFKTKQYKMIFDK